MAEQMVVQAQLKTGKCFDVTSGSGHTVTLDTAEYDGGHNAGFRPMEMLLVSLAGCTGMNVISILRKMRQSVTAYEVHVAGTRAENPPMIFVALHVEHVITGHDIQPDAVARAIQLSEERYCGAEAMLGYTASITHTYRIVDAVSAQAITVAATQAVTTTTLEHPG